MWKKNGLNEACYIERFECSSRAERCYKNHSIYDLLVRGSLVVVSYKMTVVSFLGRGGTMDGIMRTKML